jgi:hypothetical protein
MEIKSCQNCKQDFTIESEDFEFYTKIKVPPPTFAQSVRTNVALLGVVSMHYITDQIV